MKSYTIHCTQRTALGSNQESQTQVYAMRYINDDQLFFTNNSTTFCKGVPDGVFEIVASATIIHPWVMAGTPEENLSYFYNLLYDEMNEDGHIELNDCGTIFCRD